MKVDFHKDDFFGEKTSDFLWYICMRATSHPAKDYVKLKHDTNFFTVKKNSQYFILKIYIVKVWFYENTENKNVYLCSIIFNID